MVTIEICLLNYFPGREIKMHDKIAISAYIFEKSRKRSIFKALMLELRILSVYLH